MTSRRHLLPQPTRAFRLWALVCCLLSVVASCNLTVLAQVLDRGAVTLSPQRQVHESEDTIDDDDDMLRPAPRADVRRGERKATPPPGTAPPADTGSAETYRVTAPSRSRLAARLAGCEHARRNGLGAPLLC